MGDLTPVTREEYYLARMAGEDVTMPEPITREEEYMKGIADAINGDDDVEIPEPITREEEYIKNIANNVASAGSSEQAMLDGIIDKTITSVSSNNVTKIGDSVFASCTKLTKAVFPNVKIIGGYAFNHCPELATVNFPLATYIDSDAFCVCTSLTMAEFPLVKIIGKNAFYGCTSLMTANFPNATEIHTYAFRDCTSLTNFEISSKVTQIEKSAFTGCSNLATITMRPTTPPTLENTNAFTGLPNDYVIYVPNGSLSAYQTAANWSALASHIVEMEVE
jgi:hypothetical protein